jgi:hypothetical protein
LLVHSSVHRHQIAGSLQWDLMRAWTLVREIEWGAFWHVAQRKRNLMIVTPFDAFVMLPEPSQFAGRMQLISCLPLDRLIGFRHLPRSAASGGLLGEDDPPRLGDGSTSIIEGHSDCRATRLRISRTGGGELMPRLGVRQRSRWSSAHLNLYCRKCPSDNCADFLSVIVFQPPCRLCHQATP